MISMLERCVAIPRGAAGYPADLERLGELAPEVLTVFGSQDLLRLPLLALLSSVVIPGDAVLAALDVARLLRDAQVPVIGGFQTPVEQECLSFLLRGDQPLVIAPARSIAGMRLPAPWRTALDQGRLLVVSGAKEHRRRASAGLAVERNRLVAALAQRILVIHATPGGRVHRTAAEALDAGKPVFCLDGGGNPDLSILGARPARGGGLLE